MRYDRNQASAESVTQNGSGGFAEVVDGLQYQKLMIDREVQVTPVNAGDDVIVDFDQGGFGGVILAIRRLNRGEECDCVCMVIHSA